LETESGRLLRETAELYWGGAEVIGRVINLSETASHATAAITRG
jgi:hypothetical protein